MSDWALEYTEGTGGWSEITVADLMERGEAVARNGTYKCPHPDCGVTVFLQLPRSAAEPVKRTISPYFQAKRPSQHGAHVPDLRPASEGVRPPLATDTVRSADPARFPTAWRDSRPTKKEASDATEPGMTHGPPSIEGGGRGPNEGGHANSNSTVSSVRGLVRHWRIGQPGIRRVVFCFRSTAMTWENFFVDLRTAQLPIPGVRVFHAPIATVQIWGSKSVSLVLDLPNRGAEGVCNVPFGPTERDMHPTLFQRMGAVSRGAMGEAYMMGTARFSGRSMKVLPLSSGHIWIELTGE